MNKKKRNLLIMILSIIAIIGIIYFANGGKLTFSTTSAPTGTYIQVPTFMWYECAPASAPVDSSRKDISGGVAPWVKCPDNTDSCDLILHVNSFPSGYLGTCPSRFITQKCDASLSNCEQQQYFDSGEQYSEDSPTITAYTNLNQNDRIYINFQKACLPYYVDTDGAEFYARYKPFILWKNSLFSGRKEYTSESQGCTFPSGDSGNLLNSITNMVGINVNSQTSTGNDILPPYKTRNFINGYLPMAVDNINFVMYNGNQGYCQNSIVYKIGQVTTNSGTYKIVNPNYNENLGSVTCCPGDTRPNEKCNSNFQWEPLSGAQCGAFNPCAGIVPYPSGIPHQLQFFSCDNGYCVQHTQTVECTSDTDCIGNPKGNTCDTLLWECVNVAPPIITCPSSCNVDSDCDICDSTGHYTYKCDNGKCVGDEGISNCKSCDAFALNKIFGGVIPSTKCVPTALQGTTLCFMSFIKLALVAIIFLFGTLFGGDMIRKFNISIIKRYPWLSWILALIIAGILAYIVYISFWIGIIIFIIYLIFRLIVGGQLFALKQGVRALRY